MSTDTNAWYEVLTKALGDRVKQGEPLARFTTFKVGGPADLFYEAKSAEGFVLAIKTAYKNNIPLFILGGGTNILIGDKGIRGLVIKNATQKIAIAGMKGERTQEGSSSLVYVEAESGVIMNKLVRFTVEEGLSGLEMQLGLPGTVGGAVYMNSKWTKPEGYVGDVVHQATILTPKGEITVVPQSYFQFAYDTSSIQKTRDIVISVVFALRRDDKERLWKIANESVAYRRETQPQGISSAGCAFRNITPAEAVAVATPNHTTSAGFLVDHAGLKGALVGGAQISPIHANFIFNTGKATAADVVALIEKAREQVKERFGVTLEEEIVRVGEF
jgi:UDP-N-acetylmuramate dehydrogenase